MTPTAAATAFNGAVGSSAPLTSLTTNAAAALFKDSGADAIAATPAGSNTATFPKHLVLRHTEAAGSVSARTYKVRVGPATGTLYINGDASTRTYGGTRKCILTITEILP